MPRTPDHLGLKRSKAGFVGALLRDRRGLSSREFAVLFVVVLGAGASLGVSKTLAQEQASAWATRPFALEGHVGWGTPVGYLGVVADYSVLEALSFDAGFGVGSGRHGGTLHLAAGARVRILGSGAWRVNIAGAYSTGGWRAFVMPLFPSHGGVNAPEIIIFAQRIHWLHPSVGFEFRTQGGFAFRAYWGGGVMLNPSARECVLVHGDDTETPCADGYYRVPSGISSGGLALGYAF